MESHLLGRISSHDFDHHAKLGCGRSCYIPATWAAIAAATFIRADFHRLQSRAEDSLQSTDALFGGVTMLTM